MYIYQLPTRPSPLLVHYVGDSTIYQPMAHRSAVQSNQEFIRTAKSVGDKAKQNLDKPPQLYEEILCESKASGQPAYQPRDRKQLSNFQTAERARNRLSHDSLYNLYVLGFEYYDFIKEYRVDFKRQNNLVFLANGQLMNKLHQLLSPPAGAYSKMVEIYYDTTFGLGEFLVSVFCFRDYMLKGRPTIPAAFFIHQRKFACDHNAFLESLVTVCPNLAIKPFAFITDREFKDVSAFFPRVSTPIAYRIGFRWCTRNIKERFRRCHLRQKNPN